MYKKLKDCRHQGDKSNYTDKRILKQLKGDIIMFNKICKGKLHELNPIHCHVVSKINLCRKYSTRYKTDNKNVSQKYEDID